MIAVSTAASLLAVSVSAGAPPAAKPAACSVHLKITDEDGAEISKAFVLIHGNGGSHANQQLSPDRNGEVKVSLRPALYDLFVSSAGFVPMAQTLDLRSCKPLNINLMLTIDSEHPDGGGS